MTTRANPIRPPPALALLLVVAVQGCGDCTFRHVESSLEWRMLETDERGLIVGLVSTGNVRDFAAIEAAVTGPQTASGQLVGMVDAPREGRLRLASFVLPFPLSAGDVIVGSGTGGGGWGFLPAGTLDNGVRVAFDSSTPGEPLLRPTMHRLEVAALAPLRVLLSWVRQTATETTSLSGAITLRPTVTHGVCD